MSPKLRLRDGTAQLGRRLPPAAAEQGAADQVPAAAEGVRGVQSSTTTSNLQNLVDQARNLILSNTDDLRPCGAPALALLPHRPLPVLKLAHTKLHAYPWTAVPYHWRCLYTDAAILHALSLIGEGDTLPEAIKHLDHAIIIAGAPRRLSLIHRLLSSLPSPPLPDSLSALTTWPPQPHKPGTPGEPTLRFPIPRLQLPPTSITPSHLTRPVILTNLLASWPALTNWSNPSYILRHTHSGLRHVPIELGRAYTDAGWGQRILPLREFLELYILSSHSGREIAYLAQHDLLLQLPELSEDIALPGFITDAGRPVAVNVWFGPEGTVSPLHTDPRDNVFAQVVGRKYVRLYPPGADVLPRGVEAGGVDMGNTSRVEVEAVDGGEELGEEERRRWAEGAGREGWVEAVVEAGECLVIPKGWWHYVRSLETSWSVSFWWG
ncbi:Clavaminate synthase-like protein [Ascodesmis nigricans]|uniref:Clavaminate synthase-like protein n=1 Tax=Ascodesmis nigricans TaxID=341454 RepID=A0A4S2N4D6_9PEZI|nr:Clavaminate synthase-like protein [Ascodesmis nigricans]